MFMMRCVRVHGEGIRQDISSVCGLQQVVTCQHLQGSDARCVVQEEQDRTTQIMAALQAEKDAMADERSRLASMLSQTQARAPPTHLRCRCSSTVVQNTWPDMPIRACLGVLISAGVTCYQDCAKGHFVALACSPR